MLCRSCLGLTRLPSSLGGGTRRLFASHRSISSRTAPSPTQLLRILDTIPHDTRWSPACRWNRKSSSAAASPTAPAAAFGAPGLEKPDFLDEAESQIWDLLAGEFAPHELSVRDISGGCGSMYGIDISSERFRGVNMLKQQRMVNAVLGDKLKDWHGVQLKTRVP